MKRTREGEREKPGFTGCQTFPYHARNQEKPGVFARFAYFFFLSFSFSQRCVAQTNGHHGSIPTREPLVFPRAEKSSNDHVKTQTILSCARAPRRIMRIITRENRGNSLISLRERIGGVIGNDEGIPLISPPFFRIDEACNISIICYLKK